MSRGDLSEAEGRVFKDFLSIEPSMRGRGRRPTENWAVLNGILWRLRCSAPWRDVPDKYGNGTRSIGGFGAGGEAGTWEVVSITLAEMMAETGHYSIDSTIIRAHARQRG